MYLIDNKGDAQSYRGIGLAILNAGIIRRIIEARLGV